MFVPDVSLELCLQCHNCLLLQLKSLSSAGNTVYQTTLFKCYDSKGMHLGQVLAVLFNTALSMRCFRCVGFVFAWLLPLMQCILAAGDL